MFAVATGRILGAGSSYSGRCALAGGVLHGVRSGLVGTIYTQRPGGVLGVRSGLVGTMAVYVHSVQPAFH